MLAEQIRQHPELTRATLLMLSSSDQQKDAARCRALGIGGYLVKPVKQSELLETILTALSTPVGGDKKTRSRRQPGQAASTGSARPLRILLAEDNATNQMLAVTLLEKQGHTVVVAGNGQEAVDTLGREQFDLVLMDVQMPIMDGFEATFLIRSREQGTGRHIPILAMTAYAMKGDRERCLAAGMDGYVSKPIQPQELWQAMATVVPNLPHIEPEPADEQQSPDPGTGKPETAPGQGTAEVLDRAALLAKLGGREDRLRKFVQIFLGESSHLMEEMRAAIAAGDAARLKKSAHPFKGAVGNFGVAAATEAAERLQIMGKEGDLTHAGEVYAALEATMAKLRPVLLAIVEDKGG